MPTNEADALRVTHLTRCSADRGDRRDRIAGRGCRPPVARRVRARPAAIAGGFAQPPMDVTPAAFVGDPSVSSASIMVPGEQPPEQLATVIHGG